jgi:hypothetical protein
MQKGDNNARNLHILANTFNLGLFLWQVPTGLQIVDKVIWFDGAAGLLIMSNWCYSNSSGSPHDCCLAGLPVHQVALDVGRAGM